MVDELTEQQIAALEEARRVTAEEQAKGYASQRVFETRPPPETQPIDQPEPEPMTVPDITPPADAKVVERLANGQPSVVEKGGEKYFLPGSTPYEAGFRTYSEFDRAGSVSSSLGPHEGQFDGPTVILMRDGQPIARVSQAKIEQSQQPGAQFDYRAYLTPDEKGNLNDVRIPVKNSEGKEVLLTNKQADRLSGAKDDSERLDIAKDLKLVPKDTTLKEFTVSLIDLQKEQAASDFENQQFKKNNTKLKDGYISNVELKDLEQKAKTDDVTKNYLSILKTDGFEAGSRYLSDQEAQFKAANVAVPGGYIPVDNFIRLKEVNPLASDIVVEDGTKGLDKANEDAKKTIGQMGLLDAIGRLKYKPNPKLAQAVELSYSAKDIQSATGSDQSVYDQFKYVKNPYPSKGTPVKGIDAPYKPNIAPTMAILGATAVGTAELPPVSIAVLLAAAGLTAYASNKPAIDKAIDNFRKSLGRNPTPAEVAVVTKSGQVQTLSQIVGDTTKMPSITPPAKKVEEFNPQPFPTTVKGIGQLSFPVHAPEGLKHEGFSQLSPGESDIYEGLPGLLPNFGLGKTIISQGEEKPKEEQGKEVVFEPAGKSPETGDEQVKVPGINEPIDKEMASNIYDLNKAGYTTVASHYEQQISGKAPGLSGYGYIAGQTTKRTQLNEIEQALLNNGFIKTGESEGESKYELKNVKGKPIARALLGTSHLTQKIREEANLPLVKKGTEEWNIYILDPSKQKAILDGITQQLVSTTYYKTSPSPIVFIPTGGRPIIVPKDLIAAKNSLQQAIDRGDLMLAAAESATKTRTVKGEPTVSSDKFLYDILENAKSEIDYRNRIARYADERRTLFKNTHDPNYSKDEAEAVRKMLADNEEYAKIKPIYISESEFDRKLADYRTGVVAGKKLSSQVKAILEYGRAKQQYLQAVKEYNRILKTLAKKAPLKVINAKPNPVIKAAYINAQITAELAKAAGSKTAQLEKVKTLTKTLTQAQSKATEKESTQTKAQEQTKTQEAVKAREAVATKAQEATRAKEAEQTRTAEATKAGEAARTAEREAVAESETTMTTEIIDIPKKKQDQANRKRILASGGAIAWRMGQVGGKDRYDVIVDPYSSNEDYMMVLGAPPKGAVIAKGPTSAYRTAKMLYGKPPKKAVHIDSGFQDITVQPTDHKIELTFKPDPMGLTKGDIQIGHVSPRITGKPPRISAGRGRITSSRPRIGR